VKSIAILGTGPAGLMAAQAVALHGRPFSIFGLPDPSGHVRKSQIGGAQFLHRGVPTVCDPDQPDMMVRYTKRGTSQGYRAKVYGDGDVPFVSFDNVGDGETQPAWSLHDVYERMWNGICGADGHSVNALRITPNILEEWVAKGLWDLVVCTIPRPAMCLAYNGAEGQTSAHPFWSQTIKVCGEDMGANMNEIIYNGDPDQSWYRTSNMGGKVSTEWGEVAPPKYLTTYPIVKPIRHGCSCWDDSKVLFAGRYGEWRKGVLVHDAFVDTFKAMEELK
jgi:hypothetical protein